MSSVGDQLPLIAMVAMQILYAIMALLNRAALVKGMSPTVFIFYRQAIATLVISPVAYFTRKGQDSTSSMGIKSFVWIFITAFIGVVLNQTMYFEGLYLASSSIASATYNLIPAVTFLIAAALGLEKLNVKLVSSIAKIMGAMLGVGGAICMALLRGPKLLNSELSVSKSMLLQLIGDESDNTWLIGCLCLFASSCCWSSWLILQVPLTALYPDHLSLSAWMCFLSTIQAGIIGFVREPDPVAWNLNSTLQLTCLFVSGVFGSGVQFFVQSWCISRRGPFYAAMFTPLATLITTILACLFLREKIYTGRFTNKCDRNYLTFVDNFGTVRDLFLGFYLDHGQSFVYHDLFLIGAIAVIIGLYVVLWGKAEEMNVKVVDSGSDNSVNKTSQEINREMDLEELLLPNNISYKNEEI